LRSKTGAAPVSLRERSQSSRLISWLLWTMDGSDFGCPAHGQGSSGRVGEVVRRSVEGALEQNDRPRNQIPALERKTDCVPTLRAKLVEAFRAQVFRVLLEIPAILEWNG
jgi:hypothetical protein